MMAEAGQPVKLIALHGADYDPPRTRLVADAADLVVLVGKFGRQDYFRRRAAAGGERFLPGIAPVDPFAAGDQL